MVEGHTESARSDRSALQRGLWWAVVVSALLLAVIHFVEAPEYYEGRAYIGVLFVVGGLVLVLAAAAIVTGRRATLAGDLAAVVAAGMFIGGILSRTTGLPGFYEQEWDLLLVVSLVLELVYLASWLPLRRASY